MHAPNEEMIRDRAYALWVEAGSPDGNDWQFWHEAERQLIEDGGQELPEQTDEIVPLPLQAGLLSH